jgi:hypothetical protein
MSVYDLDKLYQETRRLCVMWSKQGKTTGMTSEIAAYDAARLLDLELCSDKTLGYTAVGRGERDGMRILVKGRVVHDGQKSRQRIGQLNFDQDWDDLMVVLLDEEFEPQEILEITRDQLEDEMNNKDKSNRKGPLSVAKLRAIGELVWTDQEGVVEDEVWDNKASYK